MEFVKKCAYRRQNGHCLLHHENCSCLGNCQACSDRLIPVSAEHHRRIEEWRKECPDLSSKKKRFKFMTRHAENYEVFRTCLRKRRYRDVYEAMESAREVFQREGVILAVYECPFCGGYHLTKQLRPYLPRVRVRKMEQVEEVA